MKVIPHQVPKSHTENHEFPQHQVLKPHQPQPPLLTLRSEVKERTAQVGKVIMWGAHVIQVNYTQYCSVESKTSPFSRREGMPK